MILEYENLKKRYEGFVQHLIQCRDANRPGDRLYDHFQNRIDVYQAVIDDLEFADLLREMREQIEREAANDQ